MQQRRQRPQQKRQRPQRRGRGRERRQQRRRQRRHASEQSGQKRGEENAHSNGSTLGGNRSMSGLRTRGGKSRRERERELAMRRHKRANGSAGRTCNCWKQSARQRSEHTPRRCNGTRCGPRRTSHRRGEHTSNSAKYSTRTSATTRKQLALSSYWLATGKVAGSSSTGRLIARVCLMRHKARASAPDDRVKAPQGGANQTEISHGSSLSCGQLDDGEPYLSKRPTAQLAPRRRQTRTRAAAAAAAAADAATTWAAVSGWEGRVVAAGGVKGEGTVHGLIPLTQVVDV